jgi:uncharacterized repeat protein (TIGR03803 family)
MTLHCKTVLLSVAILSSALTGCSSSVATAPTAFATTAPASAAAVVRHGGSYRVLYAFGGPPGDGSDPESGVLVDKSGRIFGTTEHGGAFIDDGSTDGTLYELEGSGSSYSETFVHSFSCAVDGCKPYDPPIEDRRGNLFLTTSGSAIGDADNGAAVEFSPEGSSYGVARVFGFSGTVGSGESASFLEVKKKLYTVTVGGGAYSVGNIIRLTPRFRESDLYDFGGSQADGKYPDGPLVADPSGALYGTTNSGGQLSNGIVFKFVSGSGGGESVLYTFQSGGGTGPSGGVILDRAGNLYGTTQGAGRYGQGVVYKLSPASGGYTETVLHAFLGNSDGSYPVGPLVLKGDLLYGATSNGGAGNCTYGCGTLFRVSTSGGRYAVLHTFEGTDGAFPRGGVALRDGALFGTTSEGPAYGGDQFGNGLVFEYTL